MSTRKYIIHDSKKHGSAKHDHVPVHGGGRNRRGDWEENEDPYYEEESDGTDVNGKTPNS